MKKDELLKLADNPDFIAGIYNYCDRWCKRCVFTRRCMVYAMEQRDSPTPETRDVQNKEFWDRLHSLFAATMEMVTDLAREHGIDLNAAYAENEQKDPREDREKVSENPIVRDAKAYSRMVKDWFERHEGFFAERGEAVERELELGIGEPEVAAVDITNAVEVNR